MIKLYGSGTPNVFKVLFMLGETGLDFELERVNVMAQEQFTPQFVALNPNSKVPVIVDTDPENAGPDGKAHTVFESGAILIYLADKTGKFLPKESAARSVAMQWLMWQMASVGPMFGQAVHFKYIAPAGTDYPRQRYMTEARRLFGVLNERLSNNAYLAGAEFSIADMATYPWTAKYFKTLGFDAADFLHVAEWVKRLEARPGLQRVNDLATTLFKEGLVKQKQADADSLDRFFGRGKYVTAGK